MCLLKPSISNCFLFLWLFGFIMGGYRTRLEKPSGPCLFLDNYFILLQSYVLIYDLLHTSSALCSHSLTAFAWLLWLTKLTKRALEMYEMVSSGVWAIDLISFIVLLIVLKLNFHFMPMIL